MISAYEALLYLKQVKRHVLLCDIIALQKYTRNTLNCILWQIYNSLISLIDFKALKNIHSAEQGR